jgi:DNA-binding CsgD family transcriptional regulator
MDDSLRGASGHIITLLVDRQARVLCAAPWPQMIGLHPWEFCWDEGVQQAWREAFVEACMFRRRSRTVSVSLRIDEREQRFEATVQPIGMGHTCEALAVCYLASHAALGIERLLSPAEADVWLLVTRGLNNKRVARELGISPATVRAHLASIRQKLGVERMEELAG